MISNPKYGWCNFDLGDFHGHPSYITPVAIDLLEDSYNYVLGKSNHITIRFDEEGSYFILVADCYDCYIIEQKDEDILHRIDIDIKDLIREIVIDIEPDIDTWAEFGIFDDLEIEVNKTWMSMMIKDIKEKYKDEK